MNNWLEASADKMKSQMKNVLSKVSGKEKRVSIFRALGEIMHSCKDDFLVQKLVTNILEEFQDEENSLGNFKTTWLDNNKICKHFFVGVS